MSKEAGKLLSHKETDFKKHTSKTKCCPHCDEFLDIKDLSKHLKEKHPNNVIGNIVICPKCGGQILKKKYAKHIANCQKNI